MSNTPVPRFAFALLCVGCATPSALPSFHWPVSTAVPVVETTVRDDRSDVVRYRLAVCPAGAGRLFVRHEDFAFVSIQGVAASDPSVADEVRKLEPLLGASPALIVSADGRYQGLRGWNEALGASPNAQGLKRFRDPRARAAVESPAGHRWRTWVETWLTHDLSLGSEQSKSETVSVGANPVEARVRYETRPGKRQGWYRVTATTKVGGQQVRDSMTRLLGVAGVPGLDLSSTDIEVVAIEEVEANWQTLQPIWAHSRKETFVTRDGHRTRQLEDKTYEFDWERARPASCTP